MRPKQPQKENLLNELDTAFQKVLQNTFSNQDFRRRLEVIYTTKDIDSLSEEEKIKALLRYSQPYEREEELERKSKTLAKSLEDFDKSLDEMKFDIDFPEIDFPEIDFPEEEIEEE